MAHREISVTFTGNGSQIMHLGPLELKGGETKYLPIKNDIATLAQLKKIGSLSVKEVTVADKDDKVAELGKDVVVKPKPPTKISVTYIGSQWENTVGGLGSFYRNQPRTDLPKEQVERFRNNIDFRITEE